MIVAGARAVGVAEACPSRVEAPHQCRRGIGLVPTRSETLETSVGRVHAVGDEAGIGTRRRFGSQAILPHVVDGDATRLRSAMDSRMRKTIEAGTRLSARWR